jgi:hypothetical protein
MPKLVTEAPDVRLGQVNHDDQSTKFGRPRRLLRFTLIVVGVLVLVAFALLVAKWPFTRGKIIADLQNAVHGTVEIGKFHQTFFPYPGCVAEDVTFKPHNVDGKISPITVRTLTIQSSYRGLFSKHVAVLRMDGVHMTSQKPAFFAEFTQNQSNSGTVVDEYLFTASTLELVRAGKSPVKFEISKLTLHSAGKNGIVRFDATLRNPAPPGELHITGSVGPINKNNPGQTPISGSYSFKNADLGVFHGIGGILSSDGNFQGVLEQFEIRARTSTPDFEVKDAAHKISLGTNFQAQVSGKNGDVALPEVMARLGWSDVALQGTVAGVPGEKGKIASLDLLLRKGRIQDFLFLFLKDRVAPMTGIFSFKGHATLPPGKEPFKKRVQLQGDFGIGDAQMSNPKTQNNLEHLSERAEGEKDAAPEKIVSDLKGHVVLRNGIATFSHLSFKVPGAKAKLHGTYSLITHEINFQGKLLMQAQLHQATGGVKSFLLKIINPILKKNHHGGGEAALSVTGVYPHPIYKTKPIADPM